MRTPPAALSIDLELFTHLPAYRNARGVTDRTDLGLDGVEWLRERLEAAGARCTFFTVSDVVEDHSGAVERLAADGHEIASHTHTHRHLTDLSPAERREELVGSKEVLESATGTEVVGFRAPSFDVGEDHFRLLDAAGYEYDSSVVPCRAIPGWYGGGYDADRPCLASELDPGAPPDLAEVPVGVMPGLRLPLTGTWLRFFGVRYTLLGMRWLARRGIAPVLYVHPWELVDLPRVEGVPRRVYVRTGAYVRRAIDRILNSSFEFVTVRELAEDAGADRHGAGRESDQSSVASGEEVDGRP